MAPRVGRAIVRLWPPVAILGLSLIAGCARMNLRGEGLDDNWGKSVENLRAPSPAIEPWGVDTRSREIEHNLGVN
jgi:hypothetical protein